MPDPEYAWIKILDIPAEFIEEYNLTGKDRDGWIYFEILQECYGLPQAGILANDLLCTRRQYCSSSQTAFDNVNGPSRKWYQLIQTSWSPYDVYTASTKRLGVVITQDNWPIGYVSQYSLARNQ